MSFINWSSYLFWGLVATLTLTGSMYSAQALGLSRMSIPFMLGTAWTENRSRATVLGLIGHFLNGLAFAFLYCWGFQEIGRATWWMGCLGGLFHALVVLSVAMPFLPHIHPNMATERHGPTPTRWLQPPGFFALNYGRRTPEVTLVAHVAYGAILGGFYRVV
jgi:hypothetical protein